MNASFCVDALHLPLNPWPLDPRDIVEGHPEIHGHVLWTSPDGRDQRGIWQISPGIVRDVEVDELFVVLSGRATLTIAGQPPIDLFPGVAGVLRAGESTIWRISETLRKVYYLRT